MELSSIHNVYLIGIGGIGMSALARYFADRGCYVTGYDSTPSPITERLQQNGIVIHFEEDLERVDHQADLVIYTPAVPPHHRELAYFSENGYNVMKRAEVLGAITEQMTTVAVAGSHGKTTVSAMISHLLKETGVDCNAFIGGIMTNYDSNYLKGQDDVAVVEADEYDWSFLRLNADVAVVTAVDTDHLDVYGTREQVEAAFKQFLDNLKADGIAIVQASTKLADKRQANYYSYATDGHHFDYNIANLDIHEGEYVFDVKTPGGLIEKATLRIGGRHNVENALAAFAVADKMGVEGKSAREAIKTFQGVKRRFEYRLKRSDIVYIDDYAHHPEEIKVLLESVRELHPGKSMTVVFQPHLYSRTRDLADELAKELSRCAELILLPIYPAREQPIKGVTSQLIVDKSKVMKKSLMTGDELLDYVEQNEFDIFLTVGAGDIDRLVEPIEKALDQ